MFLDLVRLANISSWVSLEASYYGQLTEAHSVLLCCQIGADLTKLLDRY